MRSRRSWMVLAIILVAAFAAANLTGSDKSMDREKEKETLMATDRAFSDLSAAKSRAAAFEVYMDDSATILRDNAHPFIGRDAIRTLMARSPRGTLKWEPFFAEVSESGDLGYTIGHWEYTDSDTTDSGGKSLGYYVTIWKKQPDGNWKFVCDTGTDGPAPEKW